MSNYSSNLVFIDKSVSEYQTLINGTKPNYEIIVLDDNRDGVTQITKVLKTRTNVASVHLVAHGAPGCLWLGNSHLSLSTLNTYKKQLQSWFSAPTSLFLYGCQVAAGDAGEEFLNKLHQLTGAKIAASKERVGSITQGGTWNLESFNAEVESGLAFNPEILQSYCGVFAVSFGLVTTYGVGAAFSPTSLTVGDFNNDGILDFVVANQIAPGGGDSFAYLRLGNGDGTFKTGVDITVGQSPQSIAVGDFNSDNKLDLITANLTSNDVTLRFGNGNGSVTSNRPRLAVNGKNPISLAVGDFNGDGKLDYVVASDGERTVGGTIIVSPNLNVRLGNGDGTFQSAVTIANSAPSEVITGDFNKDGFSDFVVMNNRNNNVQTYLSNGDGSFTALSAINIGGLSNLKSITSGDFNNDSNLDLAVYDREDDFIYVLLGSRTGNFTQSSRLSTDEFTNDLAVADLNNDGFQDLIVSGGGSAGFSFGKPFIDVWLSNGDGSFDSPTRIVTSGNDITSLAVGDFNNDGKSDLVGASSSSNQTIVVLNTTITGTVNNDQLLGTDSGEAIYGFGGADTLTGRGGNDSLIGGAGDDILTGGAGSDQYIFNSRRPFVTADLGVDTIANFNSSEGDKIVLDRTTFTQISSDGTLAANEFAVINLNVLGLDLVNNLLDGITTADIIYNQATGDLFYNQDGILPGFGSGGQFATLSGRPGLRASDFVVQA